MRPNQPNAQILYVEDDLMLREVMHEELLARGYDVVAAANADEAEHIMAGLTPDIVLCDVMMPGRNGFEFLFDLRSSGKLSDRTAFIFLTALSEREPKLKGLRAGAVDYLTKPVDYDLLFLKIENTLAYGQRREGDPAAKVFQSRYDNIHLSPREVQVLALLGAGARTIVIAHQLSLSEHTVNQYIKELYRKLGLGNRAEAARAAIELGYA